MDLESSKAWNAWANKIANRVANEHCSALVEVMGDKLIPRIIELEAEVAKLKGEPKPRLKSVGGRDA